MSVPIADSYWVAPGRLLAGEYPGAKLDADAAPRVAAFAAAGVTSFLDLTEATEPLTPYSNLLAEGTRWMRMPVRDGGIPAPSGMRAILDRIDDELAAGQVVYAHCWGGHGRTGTVVGCWLVRHGATPEAALAEIDRLRQAVPDAAWMPSPENEAQRRFVLDWISHDPDAAIAHTLGAAAAGLDVRAADKGVPALGETKDLQPELVDALRQTFAERVWPNAKTSVPAWTRVGYVDVTVRDGAASDALLLGAELKWGKLDEGVWDLFKMALLATRIDVAAAYLVTGADAKTWTNGFCTPLFADGYHSPVDLCGWRYPAGSQRLVWDWMLDGGYDSYPEAVPVQIATRRVATQKVADGAAEIRAVRVTPTTTETIPFIGGWPNGQRPADAKHPRTS